MFVVTVILGVLLGGMFIAMGAGKLSGKMDHMRDEIGLSPQLWLIDGAAGFAGGFGVLTGLMNGFEALGIAASLGLAILTGLAVGFHVRRGDTSKQLMPAGVSLLLAVLYIIFRSASI